MGNALEALARHEDSITAYREALAIVEPLSGGSAQEVAYLHINIGWSLAQLKRYDEAYAESDKGLNILMRAPGPEAGPRGLCAEQHGDHPRVAGPPCRGRGPQSSRAGRLRTLCTDISLAPKRWALRSLSKSYGALGQKRKAILFAKLAVNTHQQIRQKNSDLDQSSSSALTEKWRGLYQDLADLLVSEGRIAEGQFVLDMLKQQELIEFVRRDSNAGTESGTAGLTKRESAATEGLQGAMQGAMATLNRTR